MTSFRKLHYSIWRLRDVRLGPIAPIDRKSRPRLCKARFLRIAAARATRRERQIIALSSRYVLAAKYSKPHPWDERHNTVHDGGILMWLPWHRQSRADQFFRPPHDHHPLSPPPQQSLVIPSHTKQYMIGCCSGHSCTRCALCTAHLSASLLFHVSVLLRYVFALCASIFRGVCLV